MNTRQLAGLVCGIVMMTACSMSDLVDVESPTDTITPDNINTAAGAMRLYAATIGKMSTVYGASDGDVVLSGIFTDEFQDTTIKMREFDVRSIGGRLAQNTHVPLYSNLHGVRMQGLQAVAAMQKFPDAIPAPLVGRVYALVGYAELLLAERFCAGVPLAIIPPGGGTASYTAGLSTSDLLQRAVAHFDTAITLSGNDSVRFLSFARVGKGRALLALGRYVDAKAVVADVSTDFIYVAEFPGGGLDTNAVRPQTGGTLFTSGVGEGGNGINWYAAQDPRVPIKDTIDGALRSSKYRAANSPIVIADGVEARLIEAEADLHAERPQWLTTLNTLRARLLDGNSVRVLPDTTDPGTKAARVDLLFRERAFWLYATGHRHGDLRRLVRQYGRPVNTVFPSGPFVPRYQEAPPIYGSDVVFRIPSGTASVVNGCLDTNA